VDQEIPRLYRIQGFITVITKVPFFYLSCFTHNFLTSLCKVSYNKIYAACLVHWCNLSFGMLSTAFSQICVPCRLLYVTHDLGYLPVVTEEWRSRRSDVACEDCRVNIYALGTWFDVLVWRNKHFCTNVLKIFSLRAQQGTDCRPQHKEVIRNFGHCKTTEWIYTII